MLGKLRRDEAFAGVGNGHFCSQLSQRRWREVRDVDFKGRHAQALKQGRDAVDRSKKASATPRIAKGGGSVTDVHMKLKPTSPPDGLDLGDRTGGDKVTEQRLP